MMKSPFQQFIAAVKEVRDSLVDIPRKLSALDQDLKEQTKVVQEVRDAYQESRESGLTIQADLQVPRSLEVETSPKDKKQIREWWKLAIEALTLLAVIWYASEAHKQSGRMLESNQINRESLYSVQRAFITSTKPTTEIAEYDVVNGVRRQKPLKLIEFTYHWENVGSTPAIGIVTSVGKVEQPDDITEQEFITTAVDRSTARSALGPKGILDSGTLSDDESFLTDNPSVPRFMWGWLVYRDTFPNTKAHVTEWCYKISANDVKWKLDANGKRGGAPQIAASSCAHHNCVDEFCEDYAYITTLAK